MYWLPYSALVAKVLWLPPITAHCFRPQWATPDQPVLWRANAVQCSMSNFQCPMCTVHIAISNVQSAKCRCDIQCEKCNAFWRANAVQSDNKHRKCSGRSCGKCRRAVNCKVLLSAYLHCTLVALSDDRRGFNWSMASFVTDPEPTTRFPTAFSLKSLWLHQKSKYVTTKPLKPKSTRII